MANQMNKYFDDQFHFYQNLSDPIKKETIIRIPVSNFQNDYGWGIKDKWLTKFNNANVQNSKNQLNKLLNKSRIFVVTYASTVHNETLAANIPTIIYWDRNNWELNEDSEKDIDDLIKVGIFMIVLLLLQCLSIKIGKKYPGGILHQFRLRVKLL